MIQIVVKVDEARDGRVAVQAVCAGECSIKEARVVREILDLLKSHAFGNGSQVTEMDHASPGTRTS